MKWPGLDSNEDPGIWQLTGCLSHWKCLVNGNYVSLGSNTWLQKPQRPVIEQDIQQPDNTAFEYTSSPIPRKHHFMLNRKLPQLKHTEHIRRHQTPFSSTSISSSYTSTVNYREWEEITQQLRNPSFRTSRTWTTWNISSNQQTRQRHRHSSRTRFWSDN